MYKEREHNPDIFGNRPSFYGKPYGRDYYQEDQRAEFAMMLRRAGYVKKADAYENCRKSFILSECSDRCGNNSSNIDRMFISPTSCHARYCETCQRIYANGWRLKILPYIRSLASGSTTRGFKHIVFCFKNPENLTSAWLSSMMKTVGKLVRKYCCPRYKKRFIGGAIATVEMSPNGYWHVHCMAYCHFIDQKAMSRDFYNMTGDSWRIWITSVNRSKDGKRRDHSNQAKEAERILNEVIKYISKPVISPDVEDLFDYSMLIQGRRRVHAWGLFYNNPFMKAEKYKNVCPFCGAPLKFLAVNDRADDGSILPAWYVRDNPESAKAIDRYG